MTKFDFICDLCESRLIPSRQSLKTWRITALNELAYLYFLALRILLSDNATKHWAQHYCAHTVRPPSFDEWRSDANDLYVLLYAVTNEHDNARSSVSTSLVRDWLHHANLNDLDSKTQHLFNRLDAMFRIQNSTLKTSRRLIMHWSQTDDRERQELIDKLIEQFKRLGARSEILDHLTRLSRAYNSVQESATTGGTGAASVATCVGGLGAGFAPSETWRGIYGGKKKPAKQPPSRPSTE